MTAKEALRELVDDLPEDEAALWLERMRIRSGVSVPDTRPIWEVIRQLGEEIPDEDLARIPPSDQIDAVVYRRPGDE